MTSWTIRDGGHDDLEALLRLWRLSDALPTVSDSVESLSRLLAFDARAILIADTQGEVVGSLVSAWNGWRGSFYRLAVAPSFRRQGMASALVREGEKRLRERGAIRLDAIVTTDEASAQRFWTAAGYERQDNRSRFVRYC